jgi:hypothetical protein
MKKIFTLIVVFLGINALGQEISPQTISSSSVSFENLSSSITFTVGELIVQTFTDSVGEGGSLGSGYTNTSTSTTQVEAVDVPLKELVIVNVYPNPTVDMVYVDLQKTKLSEIYLAVYDISGKLMTEDKFQINNNHIVINTNNWAQGTYFINLIGEREEKIGVYKIIKK